jgi:hypothetical protein
MRINYNFVEFHSPVFSSGKNHGTKIQAKDGLELYYDSDVPNAKMCMKYKGKVTVFDTYHSADIGESIKTEIELKPADPHFIQENTSNRGRGRPAKVQE